MINKTSVGFMLGGIAVGVAVGLLCAPRSGKETRAEIKQDLLQLRDRASRIGHQKSAA